MARDAKTVAAELIELVARLRHDPDQCRNLLAMRLEVIYDYAYALGYSSGKTFAKQFSYDLGFADGFAKANQNLELTRGSTASVRALESAEKKPPVVPPGKTPVREKQLYHLPCKVCGALYSEDECPVCKAQETQLAAN
jgi:rubrerythrin